MNCAHKRLAVAAALILGAVSVSACGSDDLAGVNDCDIITTVTGLKDVYVVGEIAHFTIKFETRNPSASCTNSEIRKPMKFSSSASNVVSFTPTGQLMPIAPGVAIVGIGYSTDHLFTKTVTVIAAATSLRR